MNHIFIILWVAWVKTSTGQQLVATTNGVMNRKCIDKEREALLDFKANLEYHENNYFDDVCPPSWGAEEKDNCCEWYGVTCHNQTGHVVELDLSQGGCGLVGEVSPSLFNLTYLTYLDLSGNSLKGTIPSSIASLNKLRVLDLSENSLNGSIPASVTSLTDLTSLNLRWNSFHGTIPVSIGSLSELRELDLSHNSFSGTIPVSIGSLTRLTRLILSDNFFTTIPTSIGSLTELMLFDVSNNSINGNIPRSIGSLTKLYYLNLRWNSFNGTIPLELRNLANMNDLLLGNLGRCSIENLDWLSRMPYLREINMDGISLAKADNWVNVILSLEKLPELSLEGSDLSLVTRPYSYSSSSLNSSFSSDSFARYIDLRNNNLDSSMYSWLFPLTKNASIEYINLSGNKLGWIPKHLGDICHTFLYLNGSSIDMRFSNFLKNLSGCSDSIQELYASYNNLRGSLSDEIQMFPQLEFLDLSNNRLNGTISEKLWELPKLKQLDVSSNNFSGKLPHLISSFALSSLDLSSNNFYGPIPTLRSRLVTDFHSKLIRLDLSRNKLSGGIAFLCNIVNGSLSFLDLSNNLLTGKIPDCLWNFKELKVLNLGNNNLSGRIPTSVESLIGLEVLFLYNNNFSGELPFSLSNCSNLNFLDLGSNKFSGNVPVWIGEKLSRLYALSLRSNKFFGTIPLQLCQLANLQILDLSMNNLNGAIPSCVNNLTSMVQGRVLLTQNVHTYEIQWSEIDDTGNYYPPASYIDRAMIQWQGHVREFTGNLALLFSIDLSSNNLNGQIPYHIVDLHKLLALNLSKNALEGEIPPKIGQMKQLLVFDVSDNNLSGGLPSSMSQMTSLGYVNVSNNNLSGKIPSSTQLQSFQASSYTGNARLCGLPLLKLCPGDEELRMPPRTDEMEGDREDGDQLWRWFYIGGATAFPIGFWIVCSALLLNRHGRRSFFNFIDNLEDKVYVMVAMFVSKMQRSMIAYISCFFSFCFDVF